MYFAHSFYSLRYGTLSVEKLVYLAAKYKLGTLALTDINNVTAAFNFYKLCNEKGIKPILGIEFRNEKHKLLYTGIAQNHDGFYQLNKFLTGHQINKTPLPDKAADFNDAFIIVRSCFQHEEYFFNGFRSFIKIIPFLSNLNEIFYISKAKRISGCLK